MTVCPRVRYTSTMNCLHIFVDAALSLCNCLLKLSSSGLSRSKPTNRVYIKLEVTVGPIAHCETRCELRAFSNRSQTMCVSQTVLNYQVTIECHRCCQYTVMWAYRVRLGVVKLTYICKQVVTAYCFSSNTGQACRLLLGYYPQIEYSPVSGTYCPCERSRMFSCQGNCNANGGVFHSMAEVAEPAHIIPDCFEIV